MSAEYSFIEYSFNPSIYSTQEVEDRLSDLGFTKRSHSRDSAMSMWTQKMCIVILRKTLDIESAAVSGLGMSASFDKIMQAGAVYDSETGCHIKQVSGGFRILFIDRSKLEEYPLTAQEVKLSKDDYRTSGLEHVSGIVLESNDRMLMDFLQSIGFRFTKSGNRYNTLICSQNRFSIMMDKTKNSSRVRALVCDTHDVFNSTAYMVANGIPLKMFDIDRTRLQFGSLNYKIVGYNCSAFGNSDSYSIENIVDDSYANVDVIFRQRKQHLNINESTLEHYYDDSRNQTE